MKFGHRKNDQPNRVSNLILIIYVFFLIYNLFKDTCLFIIYYITIIILLLLLLLLLLLYYYINIYK